MRLGISVDAKALSSVTSEFKEVKNNPVSHISIGFFLGTRPPEIDWNSLLELDFTASFHAIDLNLPLRIDPHYCESLNSLMKSGNFLYVEEDLGIWMNDSVFLASHLVNLPLNQVSLRSCTDGINKLKSQCDCDLVVENPPVYYTNDTIDFWDYYNTLCEATDSQFAFDVGHFIGHALATQGSLKIPGKSHPIWKKIRTIHLSGVSVWQWNGIKVWLDKHDEKFLPVQLDIASAAVQRCEEQLHCLLLEMEGASADTRRANISMAQSILK
jgi:uncharacterized protein (UPF0276 family)